MADSISSTARNQLMMELMPVVVAGIRLSHMRPRYAAQALEQCLALLGSQMEGLAAMPEVDRRARVFITANRTAMALRKRVGLERALLADEEVHGWSCTAREVKREPAAPRERIERGWRRARELLARAWRGKG